jgi:hypothetical protein
VASEAGLSTRTLATAALARSCDSGKIAAEKTKEADVRTNRQEKKAYKQGEKYLDFVIQVIYDVAMGDLDQLKFVVSLPFKPPQLLLLLDLLVQLVLDFFHFLLMQFSQSDLGLLNLSFAGFERLL